MTRATLERLSALDHAFLTIESSTLPMHVGAVGIFEGDGLVGPDGALDAAALGRLVAARLDDIPRFRQRVRSLPLLGAVWARDPHFKLDYHLRHTALPRPGTRAQLDALSGRIFAERLDRDRPLWEMWLVEGLAEHRFAVVIKAHHAMLDGVAAMGVLASLLSLGPTAVPTEVKVDEPPPEPSRDDLRSALIERRLERLADLRKRASALAGAAERARLAGALRGTWELVRGLTRPSAPPTALNPRTVGPHRAFGGVRLPLEPLKQVRRAWGGTLNDVALDVVTGALRRHLTRRGEPPGPGRLVRALVPVNLRPKGAPPGAGNHVAMLVAALPVGEPDLRGRHDAIERTTRALKTTSHETDAGQLVEELGDVAPDALVGTLFDVALHRLPFEVVVTNIPGPPASLYLGTARMVDLVPLVPLFARQSLAIAVATYDGSCFIGVNADEDAVPDLTQFLGDLECSGDEFVRAALSVPTAPA